MSDDDEKSRGEQGSAVARVAGGRFAPGVTGNPNGRPKLGLSLAEMVRDGWDAAEGIQIVASIARHGEKDSDRLAAVRELWDRGHGKAAHLIQLIAPATGFDPAKLSIEELEMYESMTVKAATEPLVIDVESKEGPPE